MLRLAGQWSTSLAWRGDHIRKVSMVHLIGDRAMQTGMPYSIRFSIDRNEMLSIWKFSTMALKDQGQGAITRAMKLCPRKSS